MTTSRVTSAAAALEAASEHYRWVLANYGKGGPNAPSFSDVVFVENAYGDAESALWLAQCAESE